MPIGAHLRVERLFERQRESLLGGPIRALVDLEDDRVDDGQLRWVEVERLAPRGRTLVMGVVDRYASALAELLVGEEGTGISEEVAERKGTELYPVSRRSVKLPSAGSRHFGGGGARANSALHSRHEH
jgi:hypothetical protein